MKKVVFTTSWDDGHPLDLKLAVLLKKYGIKGTFYVPLRNRVRPVMEKKDIIKINKMGFEIGSHTLTHPILTKLDKNILIYEIRQSKKELERIIKKPVVSFCYPKGRFNKNIDSYLNVSGYCLARTTSLFHTNIKLAPFFMPTTIHFSKRTFFSYFKQGLRELNFEGFCNWLIYFKLDKNPLSLSLKVLDILSKMGGYFHLWGHSWEIEEQNLWEDLEKFLLIISKQKNVICLSNYEIVKYFNL